MLWQVVLGCSIALYALLWASICVVSTAAFISGELEPAEFVMFVVFGPSVIVVFIPEFVKSFATAVKSILEARRWRH